MQRRTFCLVAGAGIALGQTKPRSIEDFFNAFTDEWMRANPDQATYSRYFMGAEQDALDRKVAPQTTAEARKRIALARKGLRELSAFERGKMTALQQVSADTLEWQLKVIADEERFLDFSFALDQMGGWNVASVDLFTVGRPIATARDAENYVAALEQVSLRMDEAAARARSLAAKGTLPPRFILQATIKQLQSFADPSPSQNPFVVTLAEKTKLLTAMPTEQQQALVRRAEAIVSTKIYPAWKRAAVLLQSHVPKSTDEAGVSRLKGGGDAYAYFLQRYTTTNFTPDQVHEIGLRRVAEIETQMDTLLKQLGRSEGTVKQRIDKLSLDLQYPEPSSEASRAKIITDLDAIVRDAERRAALLFDLRPKARVVVQPVPTFSENNMAANYSDPAQDGSRPGTVQFPRRLDQMTKFGLRTLVYHEAVPGHHFQIALQVENKGLPRFRQLSAFGYISASVEGWALYAERLAAEQGWYDGDVEGLLGQLSDELFRARRLVVDTGLHTKGWTRQQAIDYGIEASEVERYVAWPGQACSYMVGQLKILELRDKAKMALGPKFSLREFHNSVLSAGAVPLNVLERQVDAYIAGVKEA